MVEMAPCRLTIVCFIVAVSLLCTGQAEEKKACGGAKAAVNSKRSIISNGRLNVDVSVLEKGLKKRSIAEDEDDCDQSKKSNIEIKQSAVSAVPGKNEESSNEKKSNVKGSLDYLVLPNNNNEKDSSTQSRKDKLEKPEKKHSPLWSLSKLIESVDSKGTKKTSTPGKSNVKASDTTKATKSEKTDKAVGKGSIASDPTKVIKATLSKAIEKVEKVIASKNANLITPAKANVRSNKGASDKKKTNETVEGKPKEASTNTKPKGSNSTATATVKSPNKAAVKDPYAEIALGPDRPKVPELKSDVNGQEEGAVMRMSNGEMKPVSGGGGGNGGGGGGAAAYKNAKPLAGQHDIGGLLDRLTDKLNSGGGGVAMENQPLSDTNDVKYVQSPLGMDEEGNAKQAQEFAVDKLKDQADLSEVRKMTETEGLLSGNAGADATPSIPDTQSPSEDAAQLLAGATAAASSSALSNPQTESALSAGTPSEESLTGSTAASREASLAESALSNPQTESALSAGTPSEESLTGSTAASREASLTGDASEDEGIEKSLSKASSMTTDAVMDMLKGAKGASSDFSNADVSAGPDPYGGADGQSEEALGSLLGSSKSSPSEGAQTAAGDIDSEASDLTGGESPFSEQSLQGGDGLASRSTESESDESEFERNNIPMEDDNSGSYRNKYNTEMFKKHIIMRPKRDTYVSPFDSKEAFDTAI